MVNLLTVGVCRFVEFCLFRRYGVVSVESISVKETRNTFFLIFNGVGK